MVGLGETRTLPYISTPYRSWHQALIDSANGTFRSKVCLDSRLDAGSIP